MLDNLNLFNLAFLILPVLLALTGHEFAHAWAAHRLGDDTAKLAGRLSLNPLVHLDVLGTLFLLISQLFGWAKPVPINPRNFKRPTRDLALVSLAGPALNIALALVIGLFLRLAFLAGLFNNLSPQALMLLRVLNLLVLVNFVLGCFNLLPLPPLDGFQFLATFLPPAWVGFLADKRYHLIFFIIFIILAYLGVFGRLISFLVILQYRLIYS